MFFSHCSVLKAKFVACRTSFVDRWIRESPADDPRYISLLQINWGQIFEVIEKLDNRNEYQGLGLLNFNDRDNDNWKQLLPDAEHIVLHLEPVLNNITWESLYPEWIDEEEEFEVPSCPSLPKLRAPGKPRIDLIAVKLPCKKSGNWARDVARLHLQIAAAGLAATGKSYHPVHVLFVTECFPIPNLFTCKELVAREGNVWLYEPDLNKMREKLQLPVGSCELSVPLKAKGQFYLFVICFQNSLNVMFFCAIKTSQPNHFSLNFKLFVPPRIFGSSGVMPCLIKLNTIVVNPSISKSVLGQFTRN